MFTVEGCEKCVLANAHGGPGHNNQSSRCQYLRFGYTVPHCTCRACWG